MAQESSETALDSTFGGLETVRPDLARAEAREMERRAAGDPPKVGPEKGPPPIEPEKPAPSAPPAEEARPEKEEPEEVTDPKAREAAPPGGSEAEGGRDEQSPDDEQAALDAIIGKYQGDPRSMAKAYRELRSLQTRTAEDRKGVHAQLEKALEIIDRDYVNQNGELMLRPEVAARQLRQQRGREAGLQAPPDEKAVRAEVEAEFRKSAEESFEPEVVPQILERQKSLIDKTAKDRFERASIAFQASRYQVIAEVGNIVGEHLQKFPEDKAIMPEINKIYERLPEELRPRAIIEEWLPIGQVAELVRLKSNLSGMLKQAFALGKKSKGTVTPTDGGAPSGSRPPPSNSRGGSREDAERVFKDSLIRGSGLPSIDSLRAK